MLHTLQSATGGCCIPGGPMRFPISTPLLAVSLGLAVLSLGCGQESPTVPTAPGTTLAPEGKPSGGSKLSSYDTSYMTSTIDHEEFIRQMAVLAQSKQLGHAELMTLAQNA